MKELVNADLIIMNKLKKEEKVLELHLKII